MLKTLSILLVTSTAALAMTAPSIFMGAQLHASHLSGKTLSNITIAGVPPYSSDYNFNYSSRKFHPNILIGLVWNYQNYVFGAESEYTPNPKTQSTMHHKNNFVYHNSLKAKHSYNLSARVGYHLTPDIMVYAKAIAEKRSFSHTTGRTDNHGASGEHMHEFHKMGYGGSLGFEFLLNRQWSIHTEAREINFQKINIKHKIINDETHSFKIKPSVSTFLFGFKYKIGNLI